MSRSNESLDFSVYLSKLKMIAVLTFFVCAILVGVFGKPENFTYTKFFFLSPMAPLKWLVILGGFFLAFRCLRLTWIAFRGHPFMRVADGHINYCIINNINCSLNDIEEVNFISGGGFYFKVDGKKYGIPAMFCKNTALLSANMMALSEAISKNYKQ